jgi:ABC-type lipoprotein export system ATPase subunit
VPPGPADWAAELDARAADAVPDPRASRGTPPVRGELWDLLGQPIGIRVDEVSRTFKAGEIAVTAVESVSFEVAPGEFVAITGPSGCGKSTLLAMLGGLDRPSNGRVYAAGAALDQVSQQQLDDYRLQRVGTIFQTFNLVPSLTAEDNVALPMLLAGVPSDERRQRARRLLELVGMGHRGRMRPGRLSGGEQQRVAVARALANRPGAILADEPTGNLDSSRGAEVLDLLQELNRQGATVILVTHDPEVARRADRAIRLRDGRVVPGVQSPRRTGRAPDLLDVPRRLSRGDALKLGAMSTRRRPLRTAVTAAGVAIGIGIMSLILSLAFGLQQQVVSTVAGDVQLQTVQVNGGAPGGPPRPLNAEAQATLKSLDNVKLAWGQTLIGGTLGPEGSAKPMPAVITSLPPRETGWPPSSTLAAGSMPAADDDYDILITVEQARRFGWTPDDAIGKQLHFTGQYPGPPATTGAQAAPRPQGLLLTVVGVVNGAPAGDPLWSLVPYRRAVTFSNDMITANGWKRDPFTGITILADSLAHVDAVRSEAQQAGFAATTGDDALRAFAQRLSYVELALVGLAVIALGVASLGIANTMFSAVLERTREIGIFKALGSRARDLSLIFVAESGLIGVTGGVAGIAVAGLLAAVGNQLIDRIATGQGAPGGLQLFQLHPLIAVFGIMMAVALSALSGMLPALRAASLDPVQALRYE